MNKTKSRTAIVQRLVGIRIPLEVKVAKVKAHKRVIHGKSVKVKAHYRVKIRVVSK